MALCPSSSSSCQCRAGWWCHRCRCASRCAPPCPRPPRRLVVIPFFVPLVSVPLVVVIVLPWHWPWASHHCRRRVNAGQGDVGGAVIVHACCGGWWWLLMLVVVGGVVTAVRVGGGGGGDGSGGWRHRRLRWW